MKNSSLRYFEKILIIVFLIILASGVCVELFDVAQGTGDWIGGLALTWALIFFSCCVFLLTALTVLIRIIWRDHTYTLFVQNFLFMRNSLGNFRWLFAGLLFILPVWLFQFTVWGIVFQGLFIRLMLWVIVLFLVSALLTEKDEFVNWNKFYITIILTAGAISIAASLKSASGYPFSLGWSEGNRLWDYSIMFGRARYDYPADQEIFVFLDKGRQFLGGLPFLIPAMTIKGVRTWIGLLDIFPYLLFGFALFRTESKDKWLWIALSFWTYLFLKQGPIHPPLVLIAILVAAAWRNPLWVLIPLLVFSGYFASISRYTWIFAPTIWLMMLEISSITSVENDRSGKQNWTRISILFLLGLFGALIVPELVQPGPSFLVNKISEFLHSTAASPGNLQENIIDQPLLWYRLLPNSTYGPGVFLGLLYAVAPFVFLLSYMFYKRKWRVNLLQISFIVLALLSFLAVGLVASTKIGGGGDLHNMDMFLIGLVFTAVIAVNHGGRQGLLGILNEPLWIKMLVGLMLMIPALGPLQAMRSYNFPEKTAWLVTLTGAPNERALDMYPAQPVIDESLKVIQDQINQNVNNGEILFVDQRQLLTFGFVTGVPLVTDYDKKLLIERSLSSDRDYFGRFYQDLEDKRFSLIITQPLITPKKGSDDQFGEENNAWIKWVSEPLLCYYEIKQTLVEVNVQLLIPRSAPLDCSKVLP